MGKMNGLTAESEDVFCLIIDVLDDILDTSNPTQDYVDELWTSVLLEIRGWKSDASDRDKMLVAGTVFHIVRKLLGHHWASLYCETCYDMMGVTLERELKVEDEDEESRFLDRLLDYSTELSEWINSYVSRCGFLSEEVEDVIKGEGKGKEQTPAALPPNDKQPILTSFIYCPKGMDLGERNTRLNRFFEALAENDKFICHKRTKLQEQNATDQKVFVDAFTGVQTDQRIIWTSDIKRLKYLIYHLKALELINWTAEKPKPGIVQMICARFAIRRKVFEEVDGVNKKNWKWEVCELTPSNFNAKMDKSDAELDKIIELLAPDNMKKKRGETIEDGVAQVFADEQRDVLSDEENKKEGFHPTDHQSYLES